MAAKRTPKRTLAQIVSSRTLAKRFFTPLAKALKQSLEEEKDKSWFPKFPMLAHLLTLLCFQVGPFRSLRAVVEHFSTQAPKEAVSLTLKRSTLSDANNSARRLQVLRAVFSSLLHEARGQLPGKLRKFTRLAALDSTVLWCVPSAQWAEYRKKVRACKAHVLLELASAIPGHFILSPARHHDRRYFPHFLHPGWTYIVDRAYNDYKVFAQMIAQGIFLVTRMKSNASYVILKSQKLKPAHRQKGVLQDLILRLGQGATEMNQELRLVIFRDDKGKVFHFLTNRFDLSPLSIAELYQARWAIEVFFKWLKRTLKMEKFIARSEVAAEIHILMTLITDLLLKLLAGLAAGARHIPVRTLRFIQDHLHHPVTAPMLQRIHDSLETQLC
jgi:hypothetical protein